MKDVFEWDFRRRIKFLAGCAVITVVTIFLFKYIFYYVWPFALAMCIAFLIEKPVNAIAKLFRGRKVMAAVIVVLFVVLVLVGALGYLTYVGVKEAGRLIDTWGRYAADFSRYLRSLCGYVDGWFHMDDGSSYRFICQCTNTVIGDNGEEVFEIIKNNGMPVITWIVMAVAGIVISFIATVYASTSLNGYRNFRRNCIFKEELCSIHEGIKSLVNAYFKVQLLILGINTALCVATFALLKNPYAMILGLMVGILDALPFFGTGTVLVPWAVVMLLMRRVYIAVALLVLYAVTYLVRQILESKCMGKRMGTSPFVMLAVIYMGILAFGILGVILGPLTKPLFCT